MPVQMRQLSVQPKSRALQRVTGLNNNHLRFANSRSIQRAAGAIPDQAPWDALADWLANWFAAGGYENPRPTVRRVAVAGGGGVSVDYDIEFRWANAFPYAGHNHDVVAHLHVLNEQSQAGGGIWAEGLHDSGINWNEVAGYGPFRTWMEGYIE